MSAFARPSRLFLSELDLLRAVSRITWTAESAEEGLASLEAIVLRHPGVTGLRYEPAGGEAGLGQSSVSAVAAVAANGQTYGQIRVFVETTSLTLENPLRLARFIGQQFGLLLHQTALRRERQRSFAIINAIERSLKRRKAIRRAAVILAAQRQISDVEAVSFMVGYARRNRRNLLEISESFIFGYDTSSFHTR